MRSLKLLNWTPIYEKTLHYLREFEEGALTHYAQKFILERSLSYTSPLVALIVIYSVLSAAKDTENSKGDD